MRFGRNPGHYHRGNPGGYRSRLRQCMSLLLIPLVLLVLLPLLAACTGTAAGSQTGTPPLTTGTQPPVTASDLQIVTGQTVYVPAYSQIFYGQAGLTMDLAVTLAIHNTELTAPIIIQSVQYYDTDGNLVREYVRASEPVIVPPMATTGFTVDTSDVSGGWGASFIVVWGAETPVHEPVIEALMVSTQGTHGISLISPGRILVQHYPAVPAVIPAVTPEEG